MGSTGCGLELRNEAHLEDNCKEHYTVVLRCQSFILVMSMDSGWPKKSSSGYCESLGSQPPQYLER